MLGLQIKLHRPIWSIQLNNYPKRFLGSLFIYLGEGECKRFCNRSYPALILALCATTALMSSAVSQRELPTILLKAIPGNPPHFIYLVPSEESFAIGELFILPLAKKVYWWVHPGINVHVSGSLIECQLAPEDASHKTTAIAALVSIYSHVKNYTLLHIFYIDMWRQPRMPWAWFSSRWPFISQYNPSLVPYIPAFILTFFTLFPCRQSRVTSGKRVFISMNCYWGWEARTNRWSYSRWPVWPAFKGNVVVPASSAVLPNYILQI